MYDNVGHRSQPDKRLARYPGTSVKPGSLFSQAGRPRGRPRACWLPTPPAREATPRPRFRKRHERELVVLSQRTSGVTAAPLRQNNSSGSAHASTNTPNNVISQGTFSPGS